jgi:hypothetical protein
MKGGPNELEDNPDFKLAASAMLIGCGGMSLQSPSNPPVMPLQSTMQAGQWEFTIASSDGSTDVYVESNLTAKPSGGISSNTTATALYWTQGGSTDKLAALYVYCRGVQAAFSTTGNNVIALLFEGTTQIAQATATLSADGKSMNGSFQLSGGTSLCGTLVTAAGTFTGQTIAPLNGTYKGNLSDNHSWTMQITPKALTLTGAGRRRLRV